MNVKKVFAAIVLPPNNRNFDVEVTRPTRIVIEWGEGGNVFITSVSTFVHNYV